jgi:hypothetical protein
MFEQACSNITWPTLLWLFSWFIRSIMKMRGIFVTDDIVLGDDVLLLDFDLNVGVYGETPFVDLGRG